VDGRERCPVEIMSWHFLEGLEESHEMSVRTAGHLAEI
jgi:hypothetical protein